MNKIITATTIFFMLFSLNVFAHENVGSPEEVLSEIRESQGISAATQIDCNKVTEHHFEELGDALMEQMHSGEAHETMDAMMGGEGSESLKAMHVSMGKSYLLCGGGNEMMGNNVSGYGMPFQNYMQGGMTGGSMMQGMMGNNSFSSGMPFWNYGYWSIWNILYAVLLIGLIALVFLSVFRLWKDINKKEVKE